MEAHMPESQTKRRSSMKTRNFGVSAGEKLLRKQRALKAGKAIVETIANPNPAETSRRFIRVRREPMRTQKADNSRHPASGVPIQDRREP